MSQLDKGSIRINRFIAMCGVCSRRKAEDLIKDGQISINNKIIDQLGIKVSSEDVVCFNGKQISPEKKRYILLNKPSGYITTMNDEKGRETVMMLIQDACRERLVPVGRLDRETTGLLLFTNDGQLAKKLSHPKYNITKTYNVTLDRNIKPNVIHKIQGGVNLNDGFVKVDTINYIGNSQRELKIKIHSGKNRIIRRIFEFLNYSVIKLDRVGFSFLTKKKMRLHDWRFLTKREVELLKKTTNEIAYED